MRRLRRGQSAEHDKDSEYKVQPNSTIQHVDIKIKQFGNLRATICQSHKPRLPGAGRPLDVSDADSKRKSFERFYDN